MSVSRVTAICVAMLAISLLVVSCGEYGSGPISSDRAADVRITQGAAKSFTKLWPPSPLPDGVAPNGHGRAEIESEPGKRLRLKIDVDDVEVIGTAGDPEFCNGFYEAVLKDGGSEVALPVFAGLIITCNVADNPQGPTRGFLNVDVRLDKGETFVNPRGMTLQIWEVEPVRDEVTHKAVKGPNGEPFEIEARRVIALEGVLQ